MENNKKSNLIEMGICTKPHGIRGAFSFVLSNQEDSCLKKGSIVTLFPKGSGSSIPSEGQDFTISKIQFGNKTIAFLKDIDNRNVTEAMIPFTIMIDRSSFPELDESEFYLNDLIGLKVTNHETGEDIGFVRDFYDNTVQIILVIKGNGRKIEVPFLDHFVPELDLEAGTMSVIVPVFV